MAGKFPRDKANELLAACHRRCCICHRFCGSKIELDHIDPGYAGGSDSIENAIPVCFDCHAEIHAYNKDHPRGRKYRPAELRRHKDQWLRICQDKPSVFDGAAGRTPAGPLEAMLDELEFNLFLAKNGGEYCGFIDDQFRRATAAGALTILDGVVREVVFSCYSFIFGYRKIVATGLYQWTDNSYSKPVEHAWHPQEEKDRFAYEHGILKIQAARDALWAFMKDGADEEP